LGDNGKIFMAIMIMISTFGCLHGIILTAARVYHAMAKDGLFFKQAGILNKNEVPANSLLMQCAWACLLTLSGSYGQLLDYIMFAVMLFYIFTVAAVFVLRHKRPDMERPYKTWGYPILPALYILMAIFVMLSILIYKFDFAVRGLVIILLGIPIYYLFKATNQTPSSN